MRRCTLAISLSIFTLAAACADNVTAPTHMDQKRSNVIVFRPPPSFVEIAAGGAFTCVRNTSGAVYCWGNDGVEQTGLPSVNCVDVSDPNPDPRKRRTWPCTPKPQLVTMHDGTAINATHVDVGDGHACVVTTSSDGICWGADDVGQVGAFNGTAAGQPVAGYTTMMDPTLVAGGLKFFWIGTGGNSTCGAATTGFFCWGEIGRMIFGDPFAPNGTPNTPLQVSTFSGYRYASIGNQHGCTLDANATGHFAACWGDNRFGQSAIDTKIIPNPTIPFAVGASFGGPLNRVVSRYDETCGELVSGQLQCAGENWFGSIGDGKTPSQEPRDSVPQTVGGGQHLHAVTIGKDHACALDDAGLAFCWGNPANGQLGNGVTTGSFPSPIAVSGGLTFRAIAAGVDHTCAITTDNRIFCWGNNNAAQLGLGFLASNGISSTPMQVAAF